MFPLKQFSKYLECVDWISSRELNYIQSYSLLVLSKEFHVEFFELVQHILQFFCLRKDGGPGEKKIKMN